VLYFKFKIKFINTNRFKEDEVKMRKEKQKERKEERKEGRKKGQTYATD
jgi:hypothetical protein